MSSGKKMTFGEATILQLVNEWNLSVALTIRDLREGQFDTAKRIRKEAARIDNHIRREVKKALAEHRAKVHSDAMSAALSLAADRVRSKKPRGKRCEGCNERATRHDSEGGSLSGTVVGSGKSKKASVKK